MNHAVALTRLFSLAGTLGLALFQLSSSVSALMAIETSSRAVQPQSGQLALDLPQRKPPTLTQGGATRSGSDLKYAPPANLPKRSRPSVTGGAATRSTDPVIELLAPQDHTGVTAMARPTFFWYMSAQPSTPIEFSLRDEQADQTVLVSRVTVPAAGLVKFELPKDMPALVPNKDYSWSVSLVHDVKDGEANTTYKAFLRLQTMTPQQTEALRSADSPRDRAAVLAQEGVWYDAIAQLAWAYLRDPKGSSTQEDVLSLLSQVNLDQVVDLSPSSEAPTRSTSTPSPSPAQTGVSTPRNPQQNSL
jgi:hypothetical protein